LLARLRLNQCLWLYLRLNWLNWLLRLLLFRWLLLLCCGWGYCSGSRWRFDTRLFCFTTGMLALSEHESKHNPAAENQCDARHQQNGATVAR
jgi:hypothetical protein